LKKNKTTLSRRQIAVISVAVVLVAGAISAALLVQAPPPKISFPLTAGIIDPLAEEIPNPLFVKNVTKALETYGFNVTYDNGTLGVDFFQNLANYNYGIIILRAHSALRADGSTVDLFTSEPYDPSAHLEEQQNGLLVEGFLNYTDVKTEYFAMTSKFIENLQGNFPKSIIIAMGCNTLAPGLAQLAEAFNKKGASAFIGWNGYVGNVVTDDETENLVNKLTVNNETVGQAIDGVWDTWFGSKMECYPQKAQDLKISYLTSTFSGASNAQSTTSNPWQRGQTSSQTILQIAQSGSSVPATLTKTEVLQGSRRIRETYLRTQPQLD